MRGAASREKNADDQLVLVLPNHKCSAFTNAPDYGFAITIHTALSDGVNIGKPEIIPVDAVYGQRCLINGITSPFQ